MKNITDLTEDEISFFLAQKVVDFLEETGRNFDEFPMGEFLDWFNNAFVMVSLLNLWYKDQIVLTDFDTEPSFGPAENAQLTGIWKDILEIDKENSL